MKRYCKIEKGSEYYDNILNLWNRYNECRKAIKNIALKYSNNPQWYGNRNPFVFCGGIDAFQFKEAPDSKIWKKVYSDGYIPKLTSKLGKIIHKEMESLPIIEECEVQSIFGAEAKKHSYLFSIGMYKKDDVIFFVYDADIWSIDNPNIIEITNSEYSHFNNK